MNVNQNLVFYVQNNHTEKIFKTDTRENFTGIWYYRTVDFRNPRFIQSDSILHISELNEIWNKKKLWKDKSCKISLRIVAISTRIQFKGLKYVKN